MITGIIEKEKNPFVTPFWVKQGYGLTYKKKRNRQEDLPTLFDKTIDEIKRMNRNDGKYLAFVAIRWGFAEIKNKKLVPTEIWINRGLYDEFGTRLKTKRKA